jgi:hypothetical protein
VAEAGSADRADGDFRSRVGDLAGGDLLGVVALGDADPDLRSEVGALFEEAAQLVG